jgi:hypothetical protein
MAVSTLVLGQQRSTSRVNLLMERGLGRTKAVVSTWLFTAAVNFILFAIGASAGLEFGVENGQSVWGTMGLGVVVVTTILLVPGMTLAALLSLRSAKYIRVAQVVGPAISLLTIILTYSVGFEVADATVLALMHIVAVPIMVLGLELIRARDTWTRR